MTPPKKNATATMADFLAPIILTAALTFAGWHLRPIITHTDMIMIYLAGAVIVAARIGLWPGLVYSFSSVSAFNYFFIEPVFSFNVANSSYWLTFLVMFLASMIIALQAAKLREKLFLSQEREAQAKALYDLKLRNVLLSSIPHDLKTPLASIIGASDTLLHSKDARPAGEQELLLSIHNEANRFARVINNVLDIARMEDGGIVLRTSPYDPAEIIGSAVTNTRDVLKTHHLTLDVPADLPFIRVDGLLISQMLQNLLENAARHTPAGTDITVTARAIPSGFRISVQDNGPGIAPGQERAIFDKFSTSDTGSSTRGAGLGLAICQAIALAHGGSITAQNISSGGALFTIDLPASIFVPGGAA